MDVTLKETIVTICPFLTFLAALSAILISLNWYDTLKRLQTYSDLDRLLLELLKLGMDNPNFVNPEYTTNYKEKFETEDKRFKYETYAFIAWNICETIYDRKLNDERNKWKPEIEIFNRPNSKYEAETWKPVIVAENKLHRKWLNNPENSHKFKDEFIKYIQKEFPENTTIENTTIKEITPAEIMTGLIIKNTCIRIETRTNNDIQNVIQHAPNKENESDQKIKEIIEKLNSIERNCNNQQDRIEDMKTQTQALLNQLQTKDEQISKQAAHIQSLIKENNRLKIKIGLKSPK